MLDPYPQPLLWGLVPVWQYPSVVLAPLVHVPVAVTDPYEQAPPRAVESGVKSISLGGSYLTGSGRDFCFAVGI